MIEKLKNPFVDEVRERPNEFVATKADGTSEIVTIERALDNEIAQGTIANRASMQVFTDKVNEIVDAGKVKFCKLSVAAYVGDPYGPLYDGNYNVLEQKMAYGVETSPSGNGYKGIVIPQGITKIRLTCTGKLGYIPFTSSSVTANLVINGALKPINYYTQTGELDSTEWVISEDAIYNVSPGDILGLRYTRAGSKAFCGSVATSIEIEVLE